MEPDTPTGLRSTTQTRLLLRFTEGEPPALWQTAFRHPTFARKELSTVRGKDTGAYPADGSFEWTGAVRALAAYLLRCTAWGRRNIETNMPPWHTPKDFPRLEGGRCTPASSLS